MKYVKLFVLCCMLCMVSFCFVCADEITTDSAIEYDGSRDFSELAQDIPGGSTLVVVDNSNLGDAISNLVDSLGSSKDDPNDYSTLQLRSVNVSNETITAADANGFKAVILGLIGDYNTIITDYTYQNQQGYTQHSIDVTPDWSWIGSGVIFLVVVYCSFRIIGGLLCNR